MDKQKSADVYIDKQKYADIYIGKQKSADIFKNKHKRANNLKRRIKRNIFDVAASMFGGSQDLDNTKTELNTDFEIFNQNFDNIKDFSKKEIKQTINQNSKIKDLLTYARLAEAKQVFNSIKQEKYRNQIEFTQNLAITLNYLEEAVKKSSILKDINLIKTAFEENSNNEPTKRCDINSCQRILGFYIKDGTIGIHIETERFQLKEIA